ncbi:MAG: rhomboid family intramembrane serine protease [Phycisphaerae bacterium]|nr:rhomboid family intramembrane serine protease [Phycisphaerae bacterium]
MLIPYLADVVMPRWPIANWILIGMCVLAFIATGAGATTADGGGLNREEPSITQLVTYQFLHIDIWHLVGNMLFLWTFGNAVNARLGHVLYVLAYLATGAVAGLSWLLIGNGGTLIGASGAVMGVVGLFAIYYPKNEVRMFYFLFFRGGTFSVSAIWLILVYFGLDMYGTVFGRGDSVAYVSHVVGALLGAAVGWLLVARRIVPSDADEVNLLQMLGAAPKPPQSNELY